MPSRNPGVVSAVGMKNFSNNLRVSYIKVPGDMSSHSTAWSRRGGLKDD